MQESDRDPSSTSSTVSVTANPTTPIPPTTSTTTSSYANPSDNALSGAEALAPDTAQWVQYLPEQFGIRQAVSQSKYRWCAREAALWGVATGSAMTLHRLRMQPTSIGFAIHAGFASTLLVYGGSYYFCAKRRDYQEQMIELMMQLNSFEPVTEMPAQRPMDETHPFVEPIQSTTDSTSAIGGNIKTIPQRQFVAHLPERKDWQKPLGMQDAEKVFRPVVPVAEEKNAKGSG